MKKAYVIAPYISGEYTTLAMYEDNDFRVADSTDKICGVFEKTSKVKNKQNGDEIGIFHGDNNTNYIIFSDHTAKIYKE